MDLVIDGGTYEAGPAAAVGMDFVEGGECYPYCAGGSMTLLLVRGRHCEETSGKELVYIYPGVQGPRAKMEYCYCTESNHLHVPSQPHTDPQPTWKYSDLLHMPQTQTRNSHTLYSNPGVNSPSDNPTPQPAPQHQTPSQHPKPSTHPDVPPTPTAATPNAIPDNTPSKPSSTSPPKPPQTHNSAYPAGPPTSSLPSPQARRSRERRVW